MGIVTWLIIIAVVLIILVLLKRKKSENPSGSYSSLENMARRNLKNSKCCEKRNVWMLDKKGDISIEEDIIFILKLISLMFP